MNINKKKTLLKLLKEYNETKSYLSPKSIPTQINSAIKSLNNLYIEARIVYINNIYTIKCWSTIKNKLTWYDKKQIRDLLDSKLKDTDIKYQIEYY